LSFIAIRCFRLQSTIAPAGVPRRGEVKTLSPILIVPAQCPINSTCRPSKDRRIGTQTRENRCLSTYFSRITVTLSSGAAARRTCASIALIGLLLAVAACDQFNSEKIAESCVASAMKSGEPYGNAKERAQALAQLKEYCARAAAGKSP
jgi:hypothetical protein